jgi:hypothetical protein
LGAVQDRLVPGEGDLPGAGQAGGPARVDGYLAERPALRPHVLAALQAIEVAAARALGPPGPSPAAGGAGEESPFLALRPAAQDRALQAAEAAAPAPFRALVRLTYAAYYTLPAVQLAVGFGGAPPQPAGFPLAPFDEARLARVRQRGPIWRQA